MRLAALLCLPLAALLIAGCVPTTAVVPTATPTETTVISATPTPSPTPTAPTVGTPVAIECSDLLSPQVIYDFNPNFGLVGNFDPEPGSVAARAVADNGIACRWVNQTSSETIDVAVADLPDASLTALRAEAGTAVSDFSTEGYFSITSGVGIAQAFSGSFWVTASSPAFLEAQDAAPLINAAIDALG